GTGPGSERLDEASAPVRSDHIVRRAEERSGDPGPVPARPRTRPHASSDVFSLVAEGLEKGGLLPPGHDVDALPAAHLLAQLAADAGLLVDLHAAEVVGQVLGRRGDAVEGAHV